MQSSTGAVQLITMTSHCITWHDTTQAITSHQMTWPSHDLTSDTSEVTKGSLGELKNLRFTTILSVRQVRSDERVARPRKKFAFYHSFERPTRPKWRKGRSDMWKICILPQFWASDTHEVTRGLSNPQVRPLRPDRKRIDFKTFSEDFD